jgi:hypothetical protein
MDREAYGIAQRLATACGYVCGSDLLVLTSRPVEAFVKTMRAWGSASDVRVSLAFAAIGAALLLAGLTYYFVFRTVLPSPMTRLHLRSFAPAREPLALLRSLPSLIHVAAFALLTCAFLRPRMASALAAGAAWAGVDILWEFSCANHQAWLRAGGGWVGIGSVPACTYDTRDIAASIAGAAAAAGIAWLVLSLHSVPSLKARPQQ